FGDSFHLVDDVTRRRELLDTHPVLLRIDGARGARKLLAVGGLADVRRTEIERVLGWVDVDAVEKLSAEHLDAGDMPVAERGQLLDESNSIDPQIDASAPSGVFQTLRGVEARDAGTASADVRLDDDRKAKAACRLPGERGVVDDQRPRIGKPELVEDVKLQCLGRLHRLARRAVHHRDANPLEVSQPALGMKGYLTMSAQICRRTGAIEYEGERRRRLRRVIRMRGGVDALVAQTAPIELGEQRLEPVRMLVVDRDRSIGCCRHLIL